MKKMLLFLILILITSVVFGATAILGTKSDGKLVVINADSDGSLIVKTSSNSSSTSNSALNSESVLVAGTSAAFSIYLTSVNTTGTTTGRFTRYASSLTLEQLNSAGGSATNYFNVLLSTSDAIFDIVNRINEITNWTATISAGCYGLQYATGSASVRVDGEGTTDGLQYDVGGKATSISTGSANAITIYQNATQYLSKYFEPIDNKKYWVQDINTSLALGTTMYLYEGVKSTDTTTLIAIPHTNINEREYPAPVPTSNSKALEFRVMTGTWTNCTGDNILRTQIFYYTQ